MAGSTWCRSEVNRSFFLCLAACRTRSSACDTLSRSCGPARALLSRVSLGPRPWLHQLRDGSLRFVHRLHSYYDGVRLLGSVHHRLRLLVFPTRTCGIPPQAKPETSRFPCNELLHMPVSLTTPGWADPRNNASVHVAFRKTDDVGARDFQAFAAQLLAYTFPCRRFDAALADCVARLGADVVCYSFIVADFRRLLLAGFAGAPVCKIFARADSGRKSGSFERSRAAERRCSRFGPPARLIRRAADAALPLSSSLPRLLGCKARSNHPVASSRPIHAEL